MHILPVSIKCLILQMHEDQLNADGKNKYYISQQFSKGLDQGLCLIFPPSSRLW